MAGPVDVELDIFSGMPNPSWTLSDAEATELFDRVGTLSPASARPLAGTLGYRGFIVQLTYRGEPAVLRIQNGLVQLTSGEMVEHFDDPGRQLERYVLVSGESAVSPEILAMVARDLEE
jgi:hypothetical protein